MSEVLAVGAVGELVLVLDAIEGDAEIELLELPLTDKGALAFRFEEDAVGRQTCA